MSGARSFPLDWPAGVARAFKREPLHAQVSMAAQVDRLRMELRGLSIDGGLPVTDVVISSNVTLGVRMPHDPGVALHFVWDGVARCIAVDRHMRPEHNLSAIVGVVELRRREARVAGLEALRASLEGFAVGDRPGLDWRSVLEVGERATIEDVEAAFRRRALVCHPDLPGGSDRELQNVTQAREAARRELGLK
ncbi:MAG: J domain-containing protein [bacterium]|nr:J domain-containing protein [bacterium]